MSQSENQLAGAARASSPLKKKNDNTPEDTRRYNRLTAVNLSLLLYCYNARQWRIAMDYSFEALAQQVLSISILITIFQDNVIHLCL